MSIDFTTEERDHLPGRAPQKHKWFSPRHFRPWRLEEDGAFRNLSRKEQEVYIQMCEHSYLTKTNHKRRYIACTFEQLAEWAGCSKQTVATAVNKILRSFLAKRWHKGSTETGASRYELPASLNQIIFWRIHFSRKPKK